MNRRRNVSIAANPILIGSVTVLVVIVAVFLSYNANQGLPFVPTYKLDVVLPNASGLVKGNEVRMGGDRVGVVREIQAFSRRDGSTSARLSLALDDTKHHLPVDTKVRVRPKSALGLKYVELTDGTSPKTVPEGGTLAVPQSSGRPVEIDDFFNMFDTPTRDGSTDNLFAFGTGFAGRGGDLNAAFRTLEPLVTHLEPGARNLAAPKTKFAQLFPAFEQAAAEVAPVAETQGRLFANLDRTFGALAGSSEALKATIRGGPRALDVATRELPAQAGFERESAELFRRFRAPFTSLAAASPHLASAFRAGAPALKVSPQLNARVVSTLKALEAFASDPRVIPALQRLTRTANLLEPTIAFATPVQTKCNALTLLFRNLGSALSESDAVGSFLRFSLVAPPQLPGSELGPSATPANGPRGSGKVGSLEEDSFLHSNPYPNTAAPGQTQECESGNEAYTANRQVIGNVPGNQGTYVDPTKRVLK
ncbi:MAG TPA: MlaD family protein [Baekduia sp.]|uniref:MlaD family protein n=1 Tax=Baekduia sp. TaxID=2600305 RepID=UPI002B89E22F|nr:MlaD family protein [Baekduia sp.]HMJ37629.1 MlaD family protein [Baekduia sp.]